MSSAILTDSGRAGAAERAPSVQPWLFFLLTSVAIAVAAVILLRHIPAVEIALSVLTIVAAGLAAFALYRTLLPLASGVDIDAPVLVGGRTRAALERDKALTLRAIKELEFDRAMGKVSEADFALVRERLRARALRLMQQLEGSTAYRDRIEKDLELHRSRGSGYVRQGFSPAEGSPAEGSPEGLPHVRQTSVPCAECGARNDRDARFCKMCGHALQR